MSKKLFLATVIAAVMALFVTTGIAATGSAKISAKRAALPVRVSTRKLPKVGTVLVNSKGLTLYMFVPDKRTKVTCVGTCAVVWPPLKLPRGTRPVAAGLARASLLASDPDPAGGRVVTYSRWPLYTYVADTKPGVARGQARNLNGGLWYVLSPAGTVIRTKL
jgi:predicted lipoprotein with Yx(FWY)xxD motif